ncbi:MAG: FAD-binding protein [Deltaproteobacteria bacterium]|nr:FAD-binding protein [Deltaproteobacteria bacterium]MBW2661186.1 FAD-binding protein [Deltaproteobacteria bacterium]
MNLTKVAFNKLRDIVGVSNCTRAKEDLVCYAYDATARTCMPDAVLFPKNSDEVSAILRLANEHNFFVIPRGSGSGMTGGSLAVNGGIIVVMSRFNRILKIDRDNLIACVEPGVITNHLHRAVEKQGLFYPPDPASSEFSTLGGNLAECAGGPRAVKYGVTRDYVLGIELVLPTGEIINTGVQTAKGVVGYDLTRFVVGSEGTLGIITRMILRLLPLPKTIKTTMAVFGTMETAAEAVSSIIRHGIIPRTIEYMDNASIKCVESHLKLGLPVQAGALLLIEVDGNKDEVEKAVEEIKNLCIQQGATGFEIAQTKKEAANFWKARKAISPALFKYGPDKINEDIVVPRSKVPDLVRKINALRAETKLTMVSFGHAGDGNIHFNVMLDKKNKEELEKANAAIEVLFDYTLELGGTISGEHGIGITKMPYLAKEIGPVEIALMKKLKKVFDPNGVLNPGKIFPINET